jgi:sugar lactone lactonase YvrE
MMRAAHVIIGAALASVIWLGLTGGVAAGYSTISGFAASDFATGFANCCDGVGPIGIAVDGTDSVYVGDFVDGYVYKFPASGGVAGPTTRLTPSPISGNPDGLAFGQEGHLYLARQSAGDIVELNPTTGGVLRTVATGVPCPTGLATDPFSGDLFVSASYCGGTVYRVSGFAGGNLASVTAYATGFSHPDGLVFGPDGSLYVSDQQTSRPLVKVAGTNAPNPGTKTVIPTTFLRNPDGLAFAQGDGSVPPRLLVNRTDGTVTAVDLRTSGTQETDIFNGGSRGDFLGQDRDGCLYITQTDRVVKITNADGTCSLTPPTAGGCMAFCGGETSRAPTTGSESTEANGGSGARTCPTARLARMQSRAGGGIPKWIVQAASKVGLSALDLYNELGSHPALSLGLKVAYGAGFLDSLVPWSETLELARKWQNPAFQAQVLDDLYATSPGARERLSEIPQVGDWCGLSQQDKVQFYGDAEAAVSGSGPSAFLLLSAGRAMVSVWEGPYGPGAAHLRLPAIAYVAGLSKPAGSRGVSRARGLNERAIETFKLALTPRRPARNRKLRGLAKLGTRLARTQPRACRSAGVAAGRVAAGELKLGSAYSDPRGTLSRIVAAADRSGARCART